MAKENRPFLSIYVATYNHEKYIEQALDSIRMQKTTYSYEVLVGEDCSTDNTRTILKNYERRYPGFMTVFYRDHNMYKEEINNAFDLKLRCSGKYVIALEGDDFWTDENKIERQISFLEEHSEYIAVAHNCVVVDENSKITNEIYPECHDEEYSLSHYVRGIFPGQLTTIMTRNYYKDQLIDTSFVRTKLQPGDRKMYFSLICNGKIYCIQEKMSAYRHVIHGGSSYSATLVHNFDNQRQWYLEQLNYAYRINCKEGEKYAEYLYLKEILGGLKHKDISLINVLSFLKPIKHLMRSFKMLLVIR